jgi:hypothetical protein
LSLKGRHALDHQPHETSLAIRAVAHAVLAAAAASALAKSGPDGHAWREVAGVRLSQ